MIIENTVHLRKAGVSFEPERPKKRCGGLTSGGEPGTTSRCLELLVGERNREVGKEQPSFPALALKKQAGSLLGRV